MILQVNIELLVVIGELVEWLTRLIILYSFEIRASQSRPINKINQ